MNEALEDILNFKKDDAEDYYSVLGCDELSSKEQIVAEYKARVLSCHPDKHPGNAEKAAEFERIQTAKEILTDDERRQNYDKWKHSGISVTFSNWCGMRDAVHTSMHWASPKKETMLEGTESQQQQQQQQQQEGQGTNIIQVDENQEPAHPDFLGAAKLDEAKRADFGWKREPASDVLRRFRNYEI
ncbi:dnaJ homolog subfamily C member 12-like [Mya arenaria]|uniref:dnaJ homolog subfamily C member 12-like n=1 Tax=Mya arenaria TaxID=6604 RepID=UPI0022E20A7F|nr:dnaJ homolog subfamily C member 12-like [Mya arenaria]